MSIHLLYKSVRNPVVTVSILKSARRYTSLLDPLMCRKLEEVDPQISSLVKKEALRQMECVNLIPSENYTSVGCMETLGTVLQNKYSEGYPGARYYAGNEHIDHIELLCQDRALDLFNLNKDEWGVNVQALSGSPANLYVYYSLLNLHDRIMNLDLSHGGHLSHGFQLTNKKISAVSSYYETFAYQTNVDTGLVDYNELRKNAALYKPKLIVAGSSAYPREFDYKLFREIADENNAFLLADMAHVSGLVAAKLIKSPFEYADVVTTTTHKSLRGPRGALIFYRKAVRETIKEKGESYDIEKSLNSSVFPGHQGGPHNHTIGALAVALKIAKSDSFIKYQNNVLDNSKHFAKELKRNGFKLVSDGTDLHMSIIDLTNFKTVNGSILEYLLDLINITTNKNTIPGDKKAMNPKGLRVGTPAMTTRGFGKKEFGITADLIRKCADIVEKECTILGVKTLKKFKTKINSDNQNIVDLKGEVKKLASKFPTPSSYIN